jgi:hypothetical protein
LLPAKNLQAKFKMTRSKKAFVGAMALFFGFLIYISYDISSRTTFPGSKSQLKERLKKQFLRVDSTSTDSAKTIQR